MSNVNNHISIIGNICNDVDYSQTQGGVGKAVFRIGVQRRYKNPQGQREADFFNVITWRQTAEFVHQYFVKGDLVAVDGTLQLRSYDAQDGSRRYVTEIIADDIRRLKSTTGASRGAQGATPAQENAADSFQEVDNDSELPFY